MSLCLNRMSSPYLSLADSTSPESRPVFSTTCGIVTPWTVWLQLYCGEAVVLNYPQNWHNQQGCAVPLVPTLMLSYLLNCPWQMQTISSMSKVFIWKAREFRSVLFGDLCSTLRKIPQHSLSKHKVMISRVILAFSRCFQEHWMRMQCKQVVEHHCWAKKRVTTWPISI